MASLKTLSFLPQNANLFFADSHTTHKYTNCLLNMQHWQTGVKEHVRTVSKHMRTGGS
jgi:hypothetical protein